MSARNYDEFLKTKIRKHEASGFTPSNINKSLFDWQKVVVEWAVKQGRAALFEECGLGKTLQQLEWAHQIRAHTGGSILILCPLAVAPQTVREGERFGIRVTHIKG